VTRARIPRLTPLVHSELSEWGRRLLDTLDEIRALRTFTGLSQLCRKDLVGLGLDEKRIGYIEAQCWVGDYGQRDEFAAMRTSVSKKLAAEGIRLSRGKRSAPHLEVYAKDMASLLEYLGVPFRSSERSLMLVVLNRVWADLAPEAQDFRNALRKMKSAPWRRTVKAIDGPVAAIVFASVARALDPTMR